MTTKLSESQPTVASCIERLDQCSHLSMREFRDAIIEELCRLTDSEIAYFYATNITEDRLTLLGYSQSVMASCQITDRPSVYKVEETGLWGDAIRERGPVITNDYLRSDRPSKRGYPPGHVTVVSHMNLPVFAEGRIVALVGVGNKRTPYTLADAERVEALMNAVWQDFQQALWAAVW